MAKPKQQRLPPPGVNRILTATAFLSVSVLVSVLCFSKVWGDDDIFWHLATGRWIVDHGEVPSTDVFGAITQGQRWIPFEWGWDVLTFGLFRLTGNVVGIQLLTTVLWIGAFYLLMRLMRRLNIPLPLILIVSILTICASVDRMTPRPHSVTAFALALTVYLYYTFRMQPSPHPRRLYGMPALFVAWANLHPGVVAGIALLVLIALTETGFALLVPLHSGERPFKPLERRTLRALGSIIVLSLGAALLTPHGFGTYTYLYHHTHMRMLAGIDEWLPPFSAYDTFVLRSYKTLLIIAGVSFVYSLKERIALPAVVYVAAVVYSLRAVRFMADFAVVTAVGTSLGLNALATMIRWMRNMVRSVVPSLVMIVGIIAACIGIIEGSLYAKLGMYRHFGAGIDGGYFSLVMIDFLEKEKISGTPFNQLEIGGLLIWERPGEKNFIDSRNLGDSIAAEYFSTMAMHRGFEEKFNRYGIDYIILHPMNLLDSRESMLMTPIPYLSLNRRTWKLVYWDDQSFVYLRNVPKFHDVIARHEYTILHPYLSSFRRAEFDSLRAASPEVFRKEMNRKLTQEPGGVIINSIIQTLRTPFR